jgi:hypothetical protein
MYNPYVPGWKADRIQICSENGFTHSLWKIELNIHWVFFSCFLDFGSDSDTEAISHNIFNPFNPLRASFSQQNGKIDFVGDTFNHTNQV